MIKRMEISKNNSTAASMEWKAINAPSIDLRRTIIHGNRGRIHIPGSDGAMLSTLSKMIDRAHNTVLLSSFLLQGSQVTNAIDAAIDRGVDVVILTGNEDELKKEGDEFDLREDKKMRIAEHKDLMAKLAGRALIRTSPDFHAKYLLVDPNTRSQKGVFMTCNATVGALSGKNIEICAILEGAEVRPYHHHFIHGFWLMSNHEISQKGVQPLPVMSEEKLKRVLPGYIGMPCTSKGINDLRERVREIINNSKEKVTICAWAYDDGMEWQDDIKAALEKGREVTILCACSERNSNALGSLAWSGAKVLGFKDPPMHAKLVMNEAEGIIMSANLTRLGLESGFEVSYAIGMEERTVLKKIVDGWVEHSTAMLIPVIDKGAKKASASSGGIDQSDMKNVVGQTHTEKKASSKASIPEIRNAGVVSGSHQKTRSRDDGTVILPMPKGCKLARKEHGFDIFKSEDGKQSYLLVDSDENVPQAREIAMKGGYSLAVHRSDE